MRTPWRGDREFSFHLPGSISGPASLAPVVAIPPTDITIRRADVKEDAAKVRQLASRVNQLLAQVGDLKKVCRELITLAEKLDFATDEQRWKKAVKNAERVIKNAR